jgi:hypothetical protein
MKWKQKNEGKKERENDSLNKYAEFFLRQYFNSKKSILFTSILQEKYH